MAAKATYDVFLSHSSRNKPEVEKLARRLKRNGLKPFLDKWHLVAGEPWQEALEEALDQSQTVAVFLGPSGIGPWHNEELRDALDTRARDRSRRVIPVLLPGASIPKNLPRFLKRLTWVDFRNGLSDRGAFHDLVSAIKGLPPGDRRRSPTRTRPTLLGTFPHRNIFFTGREELLKQLQQQLQAKGSSALAQTAIHGLGGIGKTQTAIEYAYRFGDHYRFVLWVVAEEEADIRAAYLSIARQLTLVDFQADLDTAVQALKSWLSHENGWLLIFDNADQPALVRPYLPPTREGGKILLTSRAKDFSDVGISEPFRVGTLDPEDAVEFLLKRAKRDEFGPAGVLAKELDYLPLALSQAAAYIASVGVSLSDYLASFKRRGLQLLEKGKPGADYPSSVTTTWNLNLDAVREVSHASADLLTAAAFLVPDSVPIEIFTLGGSKLGGLLPQALEGAAEDPLVFWELLAPLEHYSLVDRLPDAAFKLHRLTQEVLKRSLSEEGMRACAERVIQALNAAYPLDELENRKLCERLQPQVWSASRLMKTYKLESLEAGQLFSRASHFGTTYSMQLGVEWHARERKKNRNIQEMMPDVEALTLALNNYSTSVDLSNEALRIRESVLGFAHPDTMRSREDLAFVFLVHNKAIFARPLYEQNLEAMECTLGCAHPDTTVATWNLLCAIRALNDTEAEARLIAKLRWLLDRDEDSIPSAQQRKIRQRLLNLLNPS